MPDFSCKPFDIKAWSASVEDEKSYKWGALSLFSYGYAVRLPFTNNNKMNITYLGVVLFSNMRE